MASTEAITELLGNFKNLVKKIAYDKTEVDDKLSTKANNSLVSQSSNGLMSSTDKVKLDGIATGANKTVVDTSISPTSTNPVQNRVINTALNGKASTATATTSTNGLMSAADKIKLNGISTEANKTIVDSALNATSTNPVQNKVINSEITSLNNNIANHTHNSLKNYSLGSDVDLNDYKTEGIYTLSWTNAQTVLNGPPGKVGGRLEVVSVQNGVRQIFHDYGQYDNRLKVYFRNYYASADEWFDWHALADDSQITSLNSTITNKVGDIQSALDKIIGV